MTLERFKRVLWRRFWNKSQVNDLLHRYTFLREHRSIYHDPLWPFHDSRELMPRRFCNKCEARRFYYCLVYTFPSKSVCVSKWTLPHVRFWKEDCFSLFPCLLQRKGRWRVADITRQNCPLLLEMCAFGPGSSGKPLGPGTSTLVLASEEKTRPEILPKPHSQ
jgi:hypothetical protein